MPTHRKRVAEFDEEFDFEGWSWIYPLLKQRRQIAATMLLDKYFETIAGGDIPGSGCGTVVHQTVKGGLADLLKQPPKVHSSAGVRSEADQVTYPVCHTDGVREGK
jgi:hypothetical protein